MICILRGRIMFVILLVMVVVRLREWWWCPIWRGQETDEWKFSTRKALESTPLFLSPAFFACLQLRTSSVQLCSSLVLMTTRLFLSRLIRSSRTVRIFIVCNMLVVSALAVYLILLTTGVVDANEKKGPKVTDKVGPSTIKVWQD